MLIERRAISPDGEYIVERGDWKIGLEHRGGSGFLAAQGLPAGSSCAKLVPWSATNILAVLKAHEQELRTAGVESVSLFGSVARGESAVHDVDVAVRLSETFSAPGLDYFSRLSELEGRLSGILGCKVDVVEEPVRKQRFQAEIDGDRALAF